MSKLFRTSLGLATVLGISAAATTAQAGCTIAKPAPVKSCISCDGPVTGHSTLPPLSSYFEHQFRCTGKTYTPRTHYSSGRTVQTAIVQNAGNSTATQTAIVQNGSSSSTQTAIVQNGGSGATQTAIVQNAGTVAPVQTAIVQNAGAGSSQTAIVQNNTYNSRIVTSPPRIVTRAPRVISRTVNTTRTVCGSATWHPACSYRPAPPPPVIRVIRPIVPVPYPVPTPVPVCVSGPCGATGYARRSRYGY
ncbi:MAG: hypothetical protein AAF311_07085 [Pseudomonadota bacterium]